MLTFTFNKNGGLRCAGGPKTFVVFPKSPGPGSELTLLPAPEENPKREVISWPGEYDVAGLTVRGIGQKEGQQVSYMVEADGTRCAFLSSPLGEWTDTDIERLGEVHVLGLPATDDAKNCQKLVDEIDPRVLFLIPDDAGQTNPEVLKTCGAQGKETVSEFKVKGSLPAEGREVVVFSA